MAVLSGPDPRAAPGAAQAFAQGPAPWAPPAAPSPPVPGGVVGAGGTVRLLPIAGSVVSASNGPVGRGLDSYRAAPVALASRVFVRRG